MGITEFVLSAGYKPRTYGRVIEHNQEAGVVNPLDLEAAVDTVPLGERGLDVPGLELLREASEGEDARNAGGELGESSSHRVGVWTGGVACGAV